MNNQQFFNSFFFHKFSYTKNRHTDNCTEHGAQTNFIGQLICGSARLISSHNTVELQEGEIVFIPKDCRYHSYWSVDKNSCLQWYSIGFDYFPNPQGHNFLLQKVAPSAPALELLRAITENPEKSIQNIGYLYCLLAHIVPTLQIDTDPHALTVQQAISCMRQDLHADMSTIARRCGVSMSTLYSAFRRCQDATPNHIRQRLLCEKAVELLCTTCLSVEQISEQLGFSSASYFRKVLNLHTGKTPRQIRSDAQGL